MQHTVWSHAAAAWLERAPVAPSDIKELKRTTEECKDKDINKLQTDWSKGSRFITASTAANAFVKYIEPSQIRLSEDHWNSSMYPPIGTKAENVLRPHQKRVIEELYDADGMIQSALVQAGCGSGKTLMFLEVAARHTKPVMIVTVNTTVCKQIKHEASEYFLHQVDWAVGYDEVVQNPKSRISVMTYDDFNKRPNARHKLLDVEASLVILDEVQLAAAENTWSVLRLLWHAEFYIGFTANVQREDGREEVLRERIGTKSIQVSQEELEIGGVVSHVDTRIAMFSNEDAAYSERAHGVSPRKTAYLLSLLDCTEGETPVSVVFVDRHNTLDSLARVLKASANATMSQINIIGPINMHTPPSRREALLDAARKTSNAVILASQGVVSVGIDVPELALVIEYEISNGSLQTLIQRKGRGARVCGGKVRAQLFTFVYAGTQEVEFARRRHRGDARIDYVNEKQTADAARSYIECVTQNIAIERARIATQPQEKKRKRPLGGA
jgi:superfamily II DNA or RNA helicase